MINKFLQSELQCQRVYLLTKRLMNLIHRGQLRMGTQAELHMYYENFNDHMRNRPNGMSEAMTIVVDTEDDSDYDDDTNYDTDHQNIEEPMYLYIANSVFAFSLFKETVWNFCAECNSNDNPSCHICRKENES